MSMTAQALSDRERELAAIISKYHDVTEDLKRSHELLNHEVTRMRQELENKNLELARRERLAALGEMATGVAHEIRNPLGGIQLFTSLLERDLEVLPESQKLVRKIAGGVDTLDKIVGDILDFAGQHDPDGRQAALLHIVGNVIDAAQGRAQLQDVEVIFDEHALRHDVWADQTRIERALLNLVLNGIDATPAGGRVVISAALGDHGFINVTVSDDGTGVDEALQQRIFNPFFTTKHSGTGLGLAIVHRIVEAHGGRVAVHNHDGGGARFTLSLPSDCSALPGPRSQEL
jgi:signal transduction histidine kinase